MVSVPGPKGMFAGEADATDGIGFSRVTVADAETEGVTLLATVTMIAPPVGITEGGTKSPPVSMVPGLPAAPAGSATDHATVVGVMPVTAAVNRQYVPIFTPMAVGAIVTLGVV